MELEEKFDSLTSIERCSFQYKLTSFAKYLAFCKKDILFQFTVHAFNEFFFGLLH